MLLNFSGKSVFSKKTAENCSGGSPWELTFDPSCVRIRRLSLPKSIYARSMGKIRFVNWRNLAYEIPNGPRHRRIRARVRQREICMRLQRQNLRLQ